MFSSTSLRLVLALSGLLSATATSLRSAPASERPRLIVLSDYFKDPDDKQSMIRLFVYANEFELEGLIVTSLAFGDGAVRAELLHELVADYARVYPNLRRHEAAGRTYPTPDALTRLVKPGARVVRTRAGAGKGFAIPYPPGGHDSRACTPAVNWIGAAHPAANPSRTAGGPTPNPAPSPVPWLSSPRIRHRPRSSPRPCPLPPPPISSRRSPTPANPGSRATAASSSRPCPDADESRADFEGSEAFQSWHLPRPLRFLRETVGLSKRIKPFYRSSRSSAEFSKSSFSALLCKLL